jgi:crotonobetainyl-CoA:carnitine CoA-transferase CaiB-like acyl-CoA transferase
VSRTGQPVKAGVALVDVVTGLHAVMGVLAALRHRDATGRGQRVEVTLLGSSLSALVNQASAYAVAGVVPGRMGNAHPSIAPYETFPTADRPIALAVGNDRQFAALCAVVGRPELAADPRLLTNADRVAHRAALGELLVERLGAAPADHWSRLLLAAGVPAGPVNGLDDAFAHAAAFGVPAVVEVPTGDGPPVRRVAHPVTFSETPARYRLPPPGPGEHTDQLFPAEPGHDSRGGGSPARGR